MRKLGEILIEVSGRHIHLSREHLDKLFGRDYKLTKLKDLSQPNQFAAQETVDIRHQDKIISKIRVVGPCRKHTQVEISLTDAFNLGLEVPIRESGDLDNTPGITVVGPKDKVELNQGVIVSQRHIHISDKEADKLGLRNKELVWVETKGPRALIFKNVLVRVDPNFSLAMQIDIDEANAAGIIKQGRGTILKQT